MKKFILFSFLFLTLSSTTFAEPVNLPTEKMEKQTIKKIVVAFETVTVFNTNQKSLEALFYSPEKTKIFKEAFYLEQLRIFYFKNTKSIDKKVDKDNYKDFILDKLLQSENHTLKLNNAGDYHKISLKNNKIIYNFFLLNTKDIKPISLSIDNVKRFSLIKNYPYNLKE